jgi:hypothetical protein
MQQPDERRLRQNEKKWTPVLMDAGWTAWPSVFLIYQRELGLSPVHVNVLLQIARCWFEAESAPWRSKTRIAKAIGMSSKTVQRAIKELSARGYLKSKVRYDAKGGRRANAFDFSGLIEAARPYAEQRAKERGERAAEKARQDSKKPGLRAVK